MQTTRLTGGYDLTAVLITLRNSVKSQSIVEHIRSDLSRVYEYNAEYAQNIADERNANRVCTPRIMIDSTLSRELKRYIVDKKYSPYAAVAELNKNGWSSKTRASEKTVYNWVKGGLIYGI